MNELRAQVLSMNPRSLQHLSLCCVGVCVAREMEWAAIRVIAKQLFTELRSEVQEPERQPLSLLTRAEARAAL